MIVCVYNILSDKYKFFKYYCIFMVIVLVKIRVFYSDDYGVFFIGFCLGRSGVYLRRELDGRRVGFK